MAKICINCGFVVKNDAMKRCPNCDAEKFERDKTAEELLNEVSFE